MAFPARNFYTPQEYLAFEADAAYKNEYHNGQIVMMAGASDPHTRISFNISGQLYNAFQTKPCRGWLGDMKGWVARENCYYYPDVIIVCNQPVFVSDRTDILTNPEVIMVILSDSTKSYDEGDKFDAYSTLDSLQHYVLIDQKRCSIRSYQRQPDQSWLLRRHTNLTDILTLSAIELEIPVAKIYDGVELTNLRVTQNQPEVLENGPTN